MAEATQRYAVVTGANKGIGLETVKQLASGGIKVVLTARDEKRGLEALERLKESGLSENVIFHRLDVADAASVTSLADFIRSQFGKLDILVNNAGINGVKYGDKSMTVLAITNSKELSQVDRKRAMIETYELAEECLQINYYGTKRTTEALLPLLQLADSATIVNVSSSLGMLEYYVSNEWAKGVLSDGESLTEEKVDEVLKEFLKDFKEGSLETKGWHNIHAAYTVSKAAMNAYTRILAEKHPNLCINCLCPGYVKTDITDNTGILTAEEGAGNVVRLALLSKGSPSGLFYRQSEVSSF